MDDKMMDALAVMCELSRERYEDNVKKRVRAAFDRDAEIAELRKMVAKLCDIISAKVGEIDRANFMEYHNFVENIKAEEKVKLEII